MVGIDSLTRRLVALDRKYDQDFAAIDASALELSDKVDGFTIVRDVLNQDEIASALDALKQSPADSSIRQRRSSEFARRNLLSVPFIRQVANSVNIRSIVERILGIDARCVRGILFDKTPDANWVVPWHQDLSIAVRERHDVAGFGPWSVKAGVVHVQPPAEVLQGMITLRIHLDECDESNGPLRVIGGTHERLLTSEEIATIPKAKQETLCTAHAGDALVMRPMLLHASSPATKPGHRRVIHLEFATGELPAPLAWHEDRDERGIVTGPGNSA